MWWLHSGDCDTTAIVSCVLENKLLPPLAVNVLLPPMQISLSPSIVTFGNGCTVTVTVPVDTQPWSLVTVTVYGGCIWGYCDTTSTRSCIPMVTTATTRCQCRMPFYTDIFIAFNRYTR